MILLVECEEWSVKFYEYLRLSACYRGHEYYGVAVC